MDTVWTRVGAAVAGGVAFLAVVQLLWGPPAGIVVQGALLGGLSALLALGLALAYRAHRILNFAQGDLGAAPASLAVLLVLDSGLSWLAGLAVGLAAAVALGAVVEILVIRRFFHSPRLILTVATIGLAQVLAGLGLLLPVWLGTPSLGGTFPEPFHASITIRAGDPVVFGGNDVVAAVAVPIAFLALALFLRTRIGLAMRASADDADRAALVGIPVRRVHTVVWMIAGALGFLAVFLRTGIVGPTLGTVLGPSLLLPALAAAVIGGMERLPTIAVAAIAIGIVQQSVLWGWNEPRYVDPVLFVVVLAALWLTPRGRGLRTGIEPSSWRSVREPRPVPRALAGLGAVRWAGATIVLIIVGALVAVPPVFGESRTNLAAVALIYGIIALSLVVLTGWAGEVSLGQMAFVGIGAAVAGSLTARLGWDLGLGMLGAGAVGAGVAVLIGLPVLRRRGLTIAVVTLAFSLATTSWLLDPRVFGPGHAFDWLPPDRIERTDLFGIIDLGSETRFYYLCLVVLAVAAVAVLALRRRRAGRAFVAVRENDRAASAFGVDPRRTVLGAFALSGFLAACAGALFVYHQHGLLTDSYSAGESLVVFTMVVIGGLASVPGALLGALFVRGVTWWLPAEWQILATGAGMLLVLLVFRGGLGAVFADVRDVYLRAVARRRGIAVPSLLGTPDPGPPHDTGRPVTTPPRTAGTPASAPVAERASLLRVRDLTVEYDGVRVLFGVDLDVADGEIVALLGTNGSGKSTVLRAVSGLVRPRHGRVTYAGRDITGLHPERIVALGVVQAPGGHGVFPSLTVAENLRLAQWRFGRRLDDDAGRDALDFFPALGTRLRERAGDLSGGEQQMLTVAMALIGRPRLLLVDELSLGLSPALAARLRERLVALRSAGTTVVMVEQSIDAALAIADRAYFLEKGEVRYAGPAAGLAAHDELVRAVFLGRASVTAPTEQSPSPEAPGEQLVLRDVTVHHGGIVAVDGASFSVHDREIVGIVGPNGAGKTTLLDAVSGFVSTDRGSVTIASESDPRELIGLPPYARARLGLGRSFQDGRLFPALTTLETIALACEHAARVRSAPAVRARVQELVELLGLEDYAEKFVHELSTGTRRVVDLACVLAHEPRVVLLDEPTSGIAQREAEALAPMLREVRDGMGTCLVVVEHDLTFLRAVADRMVALDLGRVVAVGAPEDVLSDPAVVAGYLGTA